MLFVKKWFLNLYLVFKAMFLEIINSCSPADWFPGRTIWHANGRNRLKYGHFRPRNCCRVQCTVLWLDYGIIRRCIRWSFSVLRKRAVFDYRIRAVTTLYLKNLLILIMRYSKMVYNRYFSLN